MIAKHPERTDLCIVAAALLLFIAILLPPIVIRHATYDYVVVFDITQSMNVEDYELRGLPASRLAFARESVRRALERLPCGSRIGWGVFAEYRTLLLLAPIEVCANYNDLVASLNEIDGRMRWGNASEISKGVFWAMRGARDIGGDPRVIFMTDGQEAPPLEGTSVPMFDDLKRGEIRGWLLGVGGYAPKPIPKTDPEGRPLGYWRANEVVQRETGPSKTMSHEHLSEVREPYLRKLAREIGFEYLHVVGPESVEQALLDSRFAASRPVPMDLAWVAGVGALLLLTLRFLPRLLQTRSLGTGADPQQRWRRRLPRLGQG